MEPLLQVRNVQKSYINHAVLKDISFEIYPNQIVGLLGPNGSGKTTLIKIINTLITDYSGDVLVCGRHPGIGSKDIIAYLPDTSFIRPELKIDRVIRFYADFFPSFDTVKAGEMLNAVGLDRTMQVKKLSKGMKEKLSLVIIMARKAKLYIFDEPIAGVDPAARDFILNTIVKNYSENAAILFSTHLISDAEPILSRVLFLRDGRILIDADADTLREERRMSVDRIFREEYKC